MAVRHGAESPLHRGFLMCATCEYFSKYWTMTIASKSAMCAFYGNQQSSLKMEKTWWSLPLAPETSSKQRSALETITHSPTDSQRLHPRTCQGRHGGRELCRPGTLFRATCSRSPEVTYWRWGSRAPRHIVSYPKSHEVTEPFSHTVSWGKSQCDIEPAV